MPFFVVVVIGRVDKLLDGLKVKLETAYKASGGRKVNLISHSMGGIMILCFMALHKDVSIVFPHHHLRHLCCFTGAYSHCSLAGFFKICEQVDLLGLPFPR